MKLITAVLLLLCVSFPALAQPATPPAAWTVERSKSSITVKSFDKAGKPFTTIFQSWSATVAFDPDNPKTSTATVTVDLRSSTLGEKTFTDYLVAPSWYDPAEMPFATYQITSFTKKSDTLYTANGIMHVYNKDKTNVLPIPGINLPVHIKIKKLKSGTRQGEFLSSFTFGIPDFSLPAAGQPVRRNAQRKINFTMLLKAHSGK